MCRVSRLPWIPLFSWSWHHGSHQACLLKEHAPCQRACRGAWELTRFTSGLDGVTAIVFSGTQAFWSWTVYPPCRSRQNQLEVRGARNCSRCAGCIRGLRCSRTSRKAAVTVSEGRTLLVESNRVVRSGGFRRKLGIQQCQLPVIASSLKPLCDQGMSNLVRMACPAWVISAVWTFFQCGNPAENRSTDGI
jgi:hypothetical protein